MSRVICASLLALLAGCDLLSNTCAAVFCPSGFFVNLEPADRIWLPGRYRVEATADGVTNACEVTLPLLSCGEPTFDCTNDRRDWAIWARGCSSSSNERLLSQIYFSSGPASVTLTISRDGRQVAQGSFTPTYTIRHPNGPDCEPGCRTAPAGTIEISP